MSELFGVNPLLIGACAAAASVPIIGAIAPNLLNAPDNYDAKVVKIDKSKLSDSELAQVNLRLPATEFGGPIGAACMPIFLPFLVYFLYFGCNKENLTSIFPWSTNFLQFAFNPFENGLFGFAQNVFSLDVFVAYCTWVFTHWALYYIVPGPIVEGTPLRAPYQHVRLKYKINAIYCQIISYLGIIGLVYAGIMPATYGYDNFVQLLTSAWIFSVILTTLIYLDSIIRIPREEDQLKGPLYMLSLCGNGGSFTYDYWMGRTLNPRVGFLDLKYVCELRPGLILWSLLNLSIAAAQYHELGYVSLSMVLVCIFQAYYVIDSNTSEQAILTTMDIRDDGFGFMLVFGDLTWVPFTYTMQSRYLVTYDPGLSIYAALAIVGVKLLGLWIFRSSNNEKNMFRTNPNHPSVKHLKFITTTSGRNLICSGWWGTSRHINYFGDVIMALAWSLPCGFGSIMPYFYPIYFAALLINREGRDHEKCHRNYGKDWDLYCQKVPYRIIPYVY